MKLLTEKFRRQRKFLMVLPLITLPFITLAFWSLGGGLGNDNGQEKSKVAQQGFNTSLPDASLQAGSMDKMSLYNLAEKDSQALNEARMQDPYARYIDTIPQGAGADTNRSKIYAYGSSYSGADAGIRDFQDPNELKVQQKLDELEKALNENDPDTELLPEAEKGDKSYRDSQAALPSSTQMMPDVHDGSQSDPELAQLDEMLEKILDIQHPGRVTEQLKAKSEKEAGHVFPVTTADHTGKASLLERPYIPSLPEDSGSPFIMDLQQNAFYDLTPKAPQENISREAIPVVIHETQTLVSGATVKLRLMQDVYVNGVLVPKNTFVFGICQISGERLNIQVQDIRYGNRILPVSLSVYDMDGLEGIRVPGAITRDAAKEGTDQAVQSLQLMDMNPSLATQAAGAGIETLKGLLGKKAKLVRVTVKAGYPVLLVDKESMRQ